MPSQHKEPTVSVRLPGADRTALEDYAARHGISRHEAIVRAIRGMLADWAADPDGHDERAGVLAGGRG